VAIPALPSDRIIRFSSQSLRNFAAEIFMRSGVPEPSAIIASDVLCTADEWGISSHGVARLRAYHEMLVAGRIDPIACPRIIRESPASIVIDAGNGLGLVAGPEANRLAMER